MIIINYYNNILIRIGLRRNSYTQYLIALAIVDTGAIFSEGIDMIKSYLLFHRLFLRSCFCA